MNLIADPGFDSGIADWGPLSEMGAFQMSPWTKATQGEFITPTEFAVPTGLNNSGAKCPVVGIY